MINKEDPVIPTIAEAAHKPDFEKTLRSFKEKITVLLNKDPDQFIYLINSLPYSPQVIVPVVNVLGEELVRIIIKNRTIMNKISGARQNSYNLAFLRNDKTVAILLQEHELLKDILLQYKSFLGGIIKQGINKELALAISKNDDLFSTLSLETQEGIFQTINPERILSPSLDKIERSYYARKVGHVLGLEQEQHIGSEQYEFEGSQNEVSLGWLNEFLKDYNNHHDLLGKSEKSYFTEIKDAVEFSTNLLKKGKSDYQAGAEERLYELYKKGNLTYIASGWTRHAVSIILQGDYLVYTNRGMGGDPNSGTRFYKIDKNNISPKMIKNLMSRDTEEKLHASLTEIIGDLKKPILSLPSKAQEHGTCTFVNPKASVEGMLVLCDIKENGNKPIDLQTYQVKREPYKAFANFTRDQEINNILKFAQHATTPIMEDYFVKLIAEVITHHHGGSGVRATEKKRQELERVIKLLEGMPPQIKKKFYETEGISIKRELVEKKRFYSSDVKILKDELEKAIQNCNQLIHSYSLATGNKALKIELNHALKTLNDKMVNLLEEKMKSLLSAENVHPKDINAILDKAKAAQLLGKERTTQFDNVQKEEKRAAPVTRASEAGSSNTDNESKSKEEVDGRSKVKRTYAGRGKQPPK